MGGSGYACAAGGWRVCRSVIDYNMCVKRPAPWPAACHTTIESQPGQSAAGAGRRHDLLLLLQPALAAQRALPCCGALTLLYFVQSITISDGPRARQRGGPMASIKDVAELARVSTATVSRVLANKPHVRPEVRDRVLAAVQQCAYRPNLVARNLRSQRS